jgi:hypothetical protein
VVPATHSDDEVSLGREGNRRRDVPNVRRPDDEHRPSIDHPVPRRARGVNPSSLGQHDLAGERVSEY